MGVEAGVETLLLCSKLLVRDGEGGEGDADSSGEEPLRGDRSLENGEVEGEGVNMHTAVSSASTASRLCDVPNSWLRSIMASKAFCVISGQHDSGDSGDSG